MSRVMTEAEMALADEADMVREIAYSDALRRLTDPGASTRGRLRPAQRLPPGRPYRARTTAHRLTVCTKFPMMA